MGGGGGSPLSWAAGCNQAQHAGKGKDKAVDVPRAGGTAGAVHRGAEVGKPRGAEEH